MPDVVEWRMICDEPNCSAQLVAQARHDDDAIARLHELARANDWGVHDHGLGEVNHRCPRHR